MSAKEELIAAALRLAALAERNTDDRNEWQHAIDSVREGCARAMVQPDMVEVERLIDAFGSSCDSVKKFGHITSFKPIGQQITERREARAALLAHIQRGAVPDMYDHMQGELRDLREVVMQKHARELETLRGDLNAVRSELHESQSRLKYYAAGVCAVLVVLSNINLGKLAELVR